MMFEQARRFLRDMESAIDPLTSYLECDLFEVDPNGSVLLEDFKRGYFDWRRNNGFPTVGWTKDHYSTAFQHMGIYVQRLENEPYKGGTKTGMFISGMRFAPDADGDDDAMLMQ